MKKIAIIGTGGTIAGTGSSTTDLLDYRAGQVDIGQLVEAVKELHRYEPLEYEQFVNIDSSEMRTDIWIGLARKVQMLAEREDIRGIVITHGTDTMEETAFFLQLTVKTAKPIVLTGAMRPATALSADGPLNLLQAVQVAASPDSWHKDVLVVMNGTIHSALFVQKTETVSVETFSSRARGRLGCVRDGIPYFEQQSSCYKDLKGLFFDKHLPSLADVEILYLYPQMTTLFIKALVSGNVRGLVLAGMGHGMIPQYIREALALLRAHDIILIRASRIADGMVMPLNNDEGLEIIPAYGFDPLKARILLMLALSANASMTEINAMFRNV